jgi:hypothetical protein
LLPRKTIFGAYFLHPDKSSHAMTSMTVSYILMHPKNHVRHLTSLSFSPRDARDARLSMTWIPSLI